jgi:hypothetical protein
MKQLYTLIIFSILFISCGKSEYHIVFVTGDHEYHSEMSMPMMASILEKHHNMHCTVLYAEEPDGTRNPQYEENIAGLSALDSADLAIFFLRFRQLPKEQLNLILDYLDSGKPYMGFRTTTHAFRYENGPLIKWNDEFGIGKENT